MILTVPFPDLPVAPCFELDDDFDDDVEDEDEDDEDNDEDEEDDEDDDVETWQVARMGRCR